MNKVFFGDCRDVMRCLIDDGVKVQMCVTSPPYWNLRDYGHPWQLGLEGTPEEFIANMVEVFTLVRELLSDDGTLWLNMGDSYAGGGRGGNPTEESSGLKGGQASQKASMVKRRMTTSRRRDNEPIQRSDVRIDGLKQKDLVGMPWLLAFALRASGWWLRQDIIWSKPNPMPESVRDRCTKAHEYLFLLAKSERYLCDMDTIREGRTSDEDAVTFHGNCYVAGETDNATLGKRAAIGNRRIKVPGGWDRDEGSHGTIHRNGRTSSEYQEAETKAGRNKRSVWTIATQPYKEAHFATFPRALIEPCIIAGSRPGDIVLDPFFGSGTTGEVAQNLGRQWIGIEINEAYAPLQKARTAQGGLQL